MRPSTLFFTLFLALLLANTLLWAVNIKQQNNVSHNLPSQQQLVRVLGLSDLALSTEARYTRHPAISDSLAPFMDHPGAIEHFPSGSFILPAANIPR